MNGTDGLSIILFDGVCNFCNAGIHFIIRHDRHRVFRFAALQSEAGQKLLRQFRLPQNAFDSFVLIENGKVYQKSSAGIKVCGGLPWYWQWTQLFWLVPPFLRNAVYDRVARNRYRWFGKKDACAVPPPEVRSRFL